MATAFLRIAGRRFIFSVVPTMVLLAAGTTPAWAAGSISGRVTGSDTSLGLANTLVQFYDFGATADAPPASTTTDALGNYTVNLPAGTYGVVTQNDLGYINEIYNNVSCVMVCDVHLAPGMPVTSSAVTGIDFVLDPGGRISGTIFLGGTDPAGVAVRLFNGVGGSIGTFTTNASGVYTTWGLPPGNYYVRTAVSATRNFVDQVWDHLPCAPCAVTTATTIVVTGTATIIGIDFALAAGGSISGTVTDAAGGAAVPSMAVIASDFSGVILKNTLTDVAGNYTLTGLPLGAYLVRTDPDARTQNYVTQAYFGIPFAGDTTAGNPVSVTVGTTRAGINFALVPGGSLSGTVTAAGTGDPLAGVQMVVYLPTGRFVKTAATNGAGDFTVTGLQAGTYYVSASAPSVQIPFYVDALYDNLSCAGCLTISGAGFPIITLPCTGLCTPGITIGTPVVITNGTTQTGVNFALASGAGGIAGVVKDALTGVGLLNVQVSFYNAAGVLVKSVTSAPNTGRYIVRGLAPGTYYARTSVSAATPFYTDEAYNNVPCVPCTVTTTTPIVVTTNTTTGGVDFALSSGGQISGSIVSLHTAQSLSVDVQLYDGTGFLVKTTTSSFGGGYTLNGLPAGTYYARTAVSGSLAIYGDVLYDRKPCLSCTVTTGTPILVTNGANRNALFGLFRVPTVVTDAATSVGATSATLHGTVNPNGTPATAVFEYGLTTSYGSQITPSPVPGAGNLPIAVSAVVGGLSCNTLYHFRATATNLGGTRSGADLTFTTGLCVPPTLITGAATNVTGSSPTLNGTVNPNGSATAALFQYGGSTGYGSQIVVTPAPGSGSVSVAVAAVVGLSCGRTYHFRLIAVNAAGTTNGQDSSFTLFCPPRILPIPNLFTKINTPITVPVTIESLPGATGLALFGDSTNKAVVPVANLVFGGAGANRTLTITPAVNQKGRATITVGAHDSTGTTAISFLLVVGTTTPGDYDGDRTSDLTVYRPSTGQWFRLNSSSNFTTFSLHPWGGGADIPVPGDYDGDGKADITIFRPSTGQWFVLRSTNNYVVPGFSLYNWGGGADIPLAGDFDGDGKSDITVYRPSTGQWFVLSSGSSFVNFTVTSWGGAGDVPVPADYDGDGKLDPTVYRPTTGQWFVLRSGANYAGSSLYTWGGDGDTPIVGDFDGDGKGDVTVYRPSTGQWFVLTSSSNYASFTLTSWGGGGDVPVPADYDGDGKTDIAVYRPSTGHWFALKSSTNNTTTIILQWGGAGDIPAR